MLSIIISSYQPKFYNALVKNIAETCGVIYEIIKIDNPNLMGISQAYNLGASQAQYPYLLFLHEDVLFRCNNWGEALIKHLDNQKTGIIGVAGSNYVPKVPCGWFLKNMKYQFMNIIQNSKDGSQPHLLHNMEKDKHKVFGVDGVFMGIRKDVYEKHKFNEDLKKFHGYDLDIALNIAKNYANYVVNDILLEHFSLGGADKIHFDAVVEIRKKHGHQYQEEIDNEVEWERFQNFVYSYFRFHKISVKTMFKTLPFIPSNKLTIKGFLDIAKVYYSYFRYKQYHSQRF